MGNKNISLTVRNIIHKLNNDKFEDLDLLMDMIIYVDKNIGYDLQKIKKLINNDKIFFSEENKKLLKNSATIIFILMAIDNHKLFLENKINIL